MKSHNHRGFTLIELLVVIAVVAILVGLLLPSLGKARRSGWLVKSLANVRSLMTANFAYQSDFNLYSAFAALKGANGGGRGQWKDTATDWPQIGGVASWCFGGRENLGGWTGTAGYSVGGVFDFESTDRPINRYVTDSITYPMQDQPTTRLPANSLDRKTFQLEWFRDPSDKYSYQQEWSHNASNAVFTQGFRISRDETGAYVSSYEDVGTSYHMNFKWFGYIWPSRDSNFGRAFFKGMRLFRSSEGINPSRFVFMHDQYADLVANSGSTQYRLVNGYGDANRSIMGFMDGHASYKGVIPGGLPESFNNGDYTLVFEFIRIQ